MRGRPSLQRRLLAWLAGYALLLAMVVFAHGFLVNEYAERLVWDSLMEAELDQHLRRSREDPGYRWRDTGSLELYRADAGRPLPGPLRGLDPGIHDEIRLGDREVVALVKEAEGVRHTLVLDITEFESREDTLSLFVLGSALLLVLLLVLLMAWGLRRALRPLSALAGDIAALAPDRPGQTIAPDPGATRELVVISGAVNDYLARHDRFIERERMFIDTASHELRTPMAVITGALELALQQPGLADATRTQVQRAQRTARSVEQLISLLLVLAKDPGRLARSSDHIALDELVREIIDDHRYLMQGKHLQIDASALAPCAIQAPVAIVQAAIGNLLRNAIENSDQGVIQVRLSADATLTIEDPGHGMTPEEIARIYAQVARGGGRDGGGIGLELLGRICEHLGWGLALDSEPERGTTTVLRLR